MRPSRVALVVSIAVLVLVWGTTWAAIRIGLAGVPPFTAASLRFFLSAGLLFAAHPIFRIRFDASPRARKVWLVNGLLLFFVSYGTVYWTEQWVPSGLTAVLFATFPLLVAVLASVVLPEERLKAGNWLGVLLGLLGIATIYSEDLSALAGEKTRGAAAILLLSPLATALSNVLVKRWGRGLHPVTITAVPMTIGAVALGACALVFERAAPVRFDAVSLACIGYLALFGSVLTFALYFWLLSHYAATKLALVAYGTPVVAVIVGTVFLDEPFTAKIAAGALTVLAGVAIATRPVRYRST